MEESSNIYTLASPTTDESEKWVEYLNGFSKEQLTKILKTFTPLFEKYTLMQDWDGEAQNMNKIFMQIKPSTKKAAYVEFIAHIMANSINRSVYFNSFSDSQKKLWKAIYDNYYINENQYKRIMGESPIASSSRSYYYGYNTNAKFKDDLAWFTIEVSSGWSDKEFSFSLSPTGRTLMLDYFRDNDLLLGGLVDELPDDKKLKMFNGESEMMTVLPVLRSLYLSGVLTLGRNKVTLDTIKNISSTITLKEFFTYDEATDYDEVYLRNKMLLTLFAIYGSNSITRNPAAVTQMSAAEMAKDIIPHVMFYSLYLTNLILPVLSKVYTNFTQGSYSSQVIREVKNVISTLRFDNRWMSYESFEERLRNRENNETICIYAKPSSLEDYGIINLRSNKTVRANNMLEQVGRPFIQGVLFMYASLGLIEIAYHLAAKNDPSPYSGIKYIRLTELGRYAFDIIPEYESSALNNSADLFEVSEDKLIIRSLVASNPYEIIAKEISTPIGNKRYVVTAESFLKKCYNQEQIENKISNFRNFVTKKRIPIWENFFAEILANMGKIKTNSENYIILDIDKSDLRLHEIIATDPDLKDITLRAEDYKLLLKSNQQEQFRTILKKYGYLV